MTTGIHKVKRLVVHPGKRLASAIPAGRALVHRVRHGGGDARRHRDPGARRGPVDIPLEGAHRNANAGNTDVVLIGVQHGTYFGEDDIVRLEDDFGRVDAAAETGEGRRWRKVVSSP